MADEHSMANGFAFCNILEVVLPSDSYEGGNPGSSVPAGDHASGDRITQLALCSGTPPPDSGTLSQQLPDDRNWLRGGADGGNETPTMAEISYSSLPNICDHTDPPFTHIDLQETSKLLELSPPEPPTSPRYQGGHRESSVSTGNNARTSYQGENPEGSVPTGDHARKLGLAEPNIPSSCYGGTLSQQLPDDPDRLRGGADGGNETSTMAERSYIHPNICDHTDRPFTLFDFQEISKLLELSPPEPLTSPRYQGGHQESPVSTGNHARTSYQGENPEGSVPAGDHARKLGLAEPNIPSSCYGGNPNGSVPTGYHASNTQPEFLPFSYQGENPHGSAFGDPLTQLALGSGTSCPDSGIFKQQLQGSVPVEDANSSQGANGGSEDKEKRKAAELIGSHASPPPSNEQPEDEVPKLEMVFSSEKAAYEFYKKYAENMGFQIRKGKVSRRSNGDISKRYLFCSKEGLRTKKQDNKTTRNRRKETRTGCQAKIQLTVKNKKWTVSDVNLVHNHEFVRPSQSHMSCRNFSDTPAIFPDSINEAGILAEEAADTQCGEFNVDSNNFSPILHPEDVKAFINYLTPFQVKDPSFFYSVGFDDENRIRNFFWRDGRSKIDYDYFGDVLILDTTFRTDINGMICAPFVGVNHHRHFILLGCAFLLNETAESFIWLLETFMGAMGGHQPKTIFTDHHPELASAVRKVLPETQHCFCLLQIFRNAAKHLSEKYEQLDFRRLLSRCIFDCESKEEFQSSWDYLLEQYNLRENPWLQNLYKSQKYWSHSSHSSTETTFSASIDSIRSGKVVTDVFYNVTSATMVLTKFAQQYEKEAGRRRQKELYKDFRENKSPITLKGSSLEEQAANVYTNAVFKLFREELNRSQALAIEEMAGAGAVAAYKLTEGHKKERIVAFYGADQTVTCGCKKFESDGILCAHALKVLDARNISEIPTQYILKRWKKHAKYGVVDDSGKEIIDERKRPVNLDKSELKHIALSVITKCTTKDTQEIAGRYFKRALKNVEKKLKTKNIEDLKVDNKVVASNTNGFGCLETQMVVLKSPRVDLEVTSKTGTCRMRSQKAEECKERARDIKRKSCDEANTHHQPPIKLARPGVDEGSRGALGHPNSVGSDPSKHANPQTQ